jgi:tetraacyldisaccharide 4'-kinase
VQEGQLVASEWLEEIWYPDGRESRLRRAALAPLNAAALLFRASVACRNAAYSHGWVKPFRIDGASVISVGNLNVGGAGKTPAVIYLARLCAAQGRRVAVLSRGYGRSRRGALLVSGAENSSPQESGDEPLLIARRCDAAVVLVGDDRVGLARRACRDYGSNLLILDDGMQYRRLHKDLEIVVVDESVGFGNGRLLPRGPLREPPASLGRAHLVWIRAGPRRAFDPLGRPAVRAHYAPSAAFSPSGDRELPTVIRDRRTYAFAGIARPRGFVRTLQQLSANLVGTRFFPDHHLFTKVELDGLIRDAKAANAEMLITTEKDRVRLPPDFPAWTIRLDVEILEGSDALSRRLAVL